MKGKNQEYILLNSERTTLREETTPEEIETHEMITNLRNTKISINYCNDLQNQNEIINDNVFAYSMVNEIMNNDYELQFVTEYRQRHGWLKQKEAKAKFSSLTK